MNALIEFHRGCNGKMYCFGPAGDFYTFLGAPINMLLVPVLLSVIIGTIFFLVFGRGILSSRPALRFLCALMVAGIVFIVASLIVGFQFGSRIY
jgi:hypothetical protein